MSTKKVGKTGKYGVRGGVGIRKKFLLAHFLFCLCFS